MIIQKVTKKSGTVYDVEIGDTTYQFEENTILKFRLFQGNEVDYETLKQCMVENDYESIKKRAYSYYLKYLKNRYEIIHYLLEKEISFELAQRAVDELEEEHLLEDAKLCQMVASSLARSSNGPSLIRYKLKNRHFQEKDITVAIENILPEDSEEGKEKLMRKASKKYGNLSEFERKKKVREIFYRHGYHEIDFT